MSGTKDDNETSIWYTINGGPAKLLAASGGNSKNWSGVIKLSNGVSTLSVFAQKEKLIPSAAVILQPIYFLTAPTINASIVDGAFKMSGAKPKDTAIYYSINDGSYYQLTPVTDKDTWYADNIPMIPAGLSNYKISVMAIGTFKGPSGTDILISSPSASVGVPNPGATGAGNTTPGVLNTGTVLPAGTIPTTKVKPPAITKFSGTSLSSKSMTMSGTSDPNAMILVSVQGGNSAASVIADSGGNWSVNIPLAEGVNTINLMAEHDGVISSETTTTFDTTVKFAIDPNGLTGPSVLPWEDGVIHVGGTKTKGTSIWYSTNGGGFSELVPENADTSWGADIQLLPGDSNISIIAKKSLKIPGITITGDLLKLASPVQEIAAHVNLHAWVFHDSILDRYEDSQPPVLHVHFYGLLQAYATIGELIRHDEPGNPGYPSWLNTEISSNARNPTNGFYDFDRSIPAVVGISTYYFTVQSGNLAPALAEISLDCNVKNSKWVCAEVVGVNDPSPFVDAYKQPPSFVKLVTPASGTTTTPGAGTTTPSGSGTTPPASGSTTLTTAINPPAITNLSESSLSSDGMIINGTSEPNAKILAVLQGTDFATFVSADNAGHWAVKIPFTAGANTIIFQAELEGAVSSITTTTINVNATSVEAPTIDPSPSIPAAGSIIPTADGTVTVTGGKEAGTSIWYSINGGDLVELVSENTATQWGGTIQLSAGWSQLAFIARKVLTITGIAVSGGPVLLNSTPLNFYSFYSVKPPAPEVHYTGKAEVNADQGYSPDPLFRYAGRVDFWGMLPAHTTLFTYNEMTHEYVPLSVNDTSSDALFNVTLDTNTNGWQTFFFYSGIGYPAPNGSTTWIHNTTEYTMNCHFAPSGSSCTDGFEYRNPQ